VWWRNIGHWPLLLVGVALMTGAIALPPSRMGDREMLIAIASVLLGAGVSEVVRGEAQANHDHEHDDHDHD
jgi:hypothetical protein